MLYTHICAIELQFASFDSFALPCVCECGSNSKTDIFLHSFIFLGVTRFIMLFKIRNIDPEIIAMRCENAINNKVRKCGWSIDKLPEGSIETI